LAYILENLLKKDKDTRPVYLETEKHIGQQLQPTRKRKFFGNPRVSTFA